MTMRKKTTWAASVVRKQLQTCCQHETLSLDTHEPGDDDQSCEVGDAASVDKDPPLPSLFRRKSFNASHSRSLLTTPEPQPTPYRKSVDSSLPLCTGAAAFKPRRLQYVRNSTTPLPVPPPKPKSGPLPVLRYSSFKETGSNSPVKVKKCLSGPLPILQRNTTPAAAPLPAPAPPIRMISMSGKAKELRGAAGALTRVKSSLLPSSKLPGMVTQGTLKKAAQLAKVTPVLERKGSRHGSRDGHTAAAGHGSRAPDGNAAAGSRAADAGAAGMERERAAVKIQAAMRGYRARKELAARAAEKECASVSTRMSRTNPNPPQQRRRSSARSSRPGMEQVSKSWNGSLCTAQDCQARLQSKLEAVRKRERALEYAMSRQRWKKLASSGSRKSSATPASWVADNTFPDKPGWVWNWLERAARMGAHNSPNRIYDDFDDNNDFDAAPHQNPVSDDDESLSIKSTVGVCTTELGSAGDMMPPVTAAPMTYPWPLSLRQQHAAGLLRRHPSPLLKQPSRRRHPSVCRSGDQLLSTSCVTSDEAKPVRKLEFPADDEDHGGDSESVGSCAGPLPPLQYRLSSPFGGPRAKTSSQTGLQLLQQVRMSHPNSLNQSHHHKQQQQQQQPRQPVSETVSEDDNDSAGTTAASVRRPFWRP